jgi:hypothetical protein
VLVEKIVILFEMFLKVEVFGEVPLARFGHTITQGNPKFTRFLKL